MAIWYEDDILIKPVRMPQWDTGVCKRCRKVSELASGLCEQCFDKQSDQIISGKKLRTYIVGNCKKCGKYGEIKYHMCENCCKIRGIPVGER